MQKREDDLARAIEDEGFDMRGPVGQLWPRELKSTPDTRRPSSISDCLGQDAAGKLPKRKHKSETGGLKHRSLPSSRSDHSSKGWQRRTDRCDSSTKLRTAVRDDGWEVDAIQQLDREMSF